MSSATLSPRWPTVSAAAHQAPLPPTEPDPGLGAALVRIELALREMLSLLRGQSKELLTVEELAEAVGRSAYTIRRGYLNRKSLPLVSRGPARAADS